MGYKNEFTFSYVSDSPVGNFALTMKCDTVGLPELIDQFHQFLAGCGFQVQGERLELVPQVYVSVAESADEDDDKAEESGATTALSKMDDEEKERLCRSLRETIDSITRALDEEKDVFPNEETLSDKQEPEEPCLCDPAYCTGNCGRSVADQKAEEAEIMRREAEEGQYDRGNKLDDAEKEQLCRALRQTIDSITKALDEEPCALSKAPCDCCNAEEECDASGVCVYGKELETEEKAPDIPGCCEVEQKKEYKIPEAPDCDVRFRMDTVDGYVSVAEFNQCICDIAVMNNHWVVLNFCQKTYFISPKAMEVLHLLPPSPLDYQPYLEYIANKVGKSLEIKA
jgi:hypothetical protein